MNKYTTDFEVRKATLRKLGGDPTGLQTIYEVDLAILDKIGGGGGGLTPEEVEVIAKEVAYEKVDDIKITGEDDNPRIEVGPMEHQSFVYEGDTGVAYELQQGEEFKYHYGGMTANEEVSTVTLSVTGQIGEEQYDSSIFLTTRSVGATIELNGGQSSISINNKRVLTEEDLDGVNEILESVLY